MGIKEFLKETKNYFTRKQTPTEQENPYAELSFEATQKRSLISRTLGGIGKFLGNLAYYAAVATIIPVAIAFYNTTPE